MTNEPKHINILDHPQVVEEGAEDAMPSWLNAEARDIDLSKYLLNIDQDVNLPPYLLEWKGVRFGPIGSIYALTGKKKSGKTMVSTMLMSALINEHCDGIMSVAQEVLGRKPRILWIDTEQEEAFTLMCQRRVFHKCNLDYRTPIGDLNIICLTTVQSTNERWLIAKAAINHYSPDFVLLDGIRDVIDDFNDAKASNELIRETMKIATDKQALILCALHYNEGTDKMRGHLGTELGNRVSGTLECEKHDNDEDDIWYKVNFRDMRGKPVKGIKYKINDSSFKFGVPEIMSDEDGEKRDAEERQRLLGYMLNIKWTVNGLRYTDIEKGLRKQGITSGRKLSDIISMSQSYGLIRKDEDTKNYFLIYTSGATIDSQTDMNSDNSMGDASGAPF